MRYPSWMMDQMEPDGADREPPQQTISVKVRYCQSCGAAIWWGETQTGKRCPYDIEDGAPTKRSHFWTCPDARGWSKKGAK